MICPTCGNECDSAPFGRRLKAARIASGLSREKFAEKLGYALTTINRWERGKNYPQGENFKLIEKWMREGR